MKLISKSNNDIKVSKNKFKIEDEIRIGRSQEKLGENSLIISSKEISTHHATISI